MIYYRQVSAGFLQTFTSIGTNRFSEPAISKSRISYRTFRGDTLLRDCSRCWSSSFYLLHRLHKGGGK